MVSLLFQADMTTLDFAPIFKDELIKSKINWDKVVIEYLTFLIQCFIH